MNKTKTTYRWERSPQEIKYLKGQTVIFSDSLDHWQNAVCRLPNLTNEEAVRWLEEANAWAENNHQNILSELDPSVQLECLHGAWKTLYPQSVITQAGVSLKKAQPGACGHQPADLWANAIGEDPNYAVAHCPICQHGWLIDKANPGKELHDVVEYEEEYFEGSKERLGYGSYIKQQAWRQEKADRLLRQFQASLDYRGLKLPKKPSLLDVGSGYGFFRKSADNNDWTHEGIEVSRHAAAIGEELFGYKTFVGTLEDFAAQSSKKFDLITLFDVIEHVEDPSATLQLIKKSLNKGGYAFIRTPNSFSIEREVFGNLFYSLKKEHYNYFSAQSLSLLADRAGLEPIFVTTTAHYFQGVIGHHIAYYEATLKGSDILLIGRRHD